ncbi:MAG: Kae1-associated serine/threonine protein kinase [Nanoarchaeota archaeon]|nr:Kae1-associated serine/threonine protein kinase [Nanoarchaeota archaeon]
MRKVSFGAEAVIYEKKGQLVKKRLKKGYRHPDIDLRLRKQRNRREFRLLEKLEGMKVPKLFSHEDFSFTMEKIDGSKVRDVLTRHTIAVCEAIGDMVAELHNKGVIHGDLTTSNMILSGELYLIDFGLSFYSEKAEDKAVDLHLLKQALKSKHWDIADEAFDRVVKAYEKKASHAKLTLNRLEKVEARGRYKGKN